MAAVAPYAGAWIETKSRSTPPHSIRVAPYAGAWIETTGRKGRIQVLESRSLRGSVD